jgi:acetyl-CoA carboxylase/biotin carboxylase 1
MMERLDGTYRRLKLQSSDTTLSASEAATAKTELAAREKVLYPLYTQIALQFADLHDRPSRMKAKGTIRDSLVWSESRRYFYWRLRRRLQEEESLKRLTVAKPSLSREDRLRMIHSTIASESIDLENDQAVALALEKYKSAIEAQVKASRADTITETILTMSKEDRGAVLEGLKRSLGTNLNEDDLSVSCLLL